MSILNGLRQVKHRLFVLRKKMSFLAQDGATRWTDIRGEARHRFGSAYEYTPGRYARTFLERPDPPHEEGANCPRVIYSIWLGGEMSQNRRVGLEALRERNHGIPVELVTADNLESFLLAEHPLHPAYEDLSVVHKSDYLRIYLMHFYGGGYSDIKSATHHWGPAFDQIQADDRVLAVGYRETTSWNVSPQPRFLGQDVMRYYRFLMGPSAFIMRPRSLLTGSLYREFLRRLEYCAPALKEHPGRDPYNLPAGYPIWWGDLLGDVLHPLSFKYQDRILFDERIKPNFSDYR